VGGRPPHFGEGEEGGLYIWFETKLCVTEPWHFSTTIADPAGLTVNPVADGDSENLEITRLQHPGALCAVYKVLHPPLPITMQDLIPNQEHVASVASSLPNGDVYPPLVSRQCVLPPSIFHPLAEVRPTFLCVLPQRGRGLGMGRS